jgi:hypothetical protein
MHGHYGAQGDDDNTDDDVMVKWSLKEFFLYCVLLWFCLVLE